MVLSRPPRSGAAVVLLSLVAATSTWVVVWAQEPQRRSRGQGGVIPGAGETLAPVMLEKGDKDSDKALTRDELTALAGAWFDVMDAGRAGALTPEQLSAKLGDLLPRREQGFGPALFLAPGLFAAADIDKDGTLTRAELVETFGRWAGRWDASKDGALDEEELGAGLDSAWPRPRFGRTARDSASALEAEVAKGADFTEKPPILPVTPEEEARRFLLPEGYKLELVLSDPTIAEPVAIAFDGDGRMYVAEMRTYMQDIDGKDQREPVSRVSRHEDTDGDGVYDRHTTFIDKMVLPRLVLPWDGDSVLSMDTDSDDVFTYTDTDGDGVADKKELFYRGVGRRGNLEHQQSGMVWGLDNRIYTTYNAFRLRWTPRGIVSEPTAPNGGQWGLAQDDFGKMWFVDGGGERGPLNFQVPIAYGAFNTGDQFEEGFEVVWPAAPGLGDVQGGTMRLRLPEQTLNHFTAACGESIFRGHRLPDDLKGDLLFAEPVGRLIRRAKIVVTDGLTQLRNAYPKSEFIRSTDPLFRPVNTAVAPDGTLYIVDMYRGIIQEGTWVEQGSYLRKKVQQYGLDKVIRHGRIWRLTYEGIEPDRRQPRMHGESPAQLVRHLEHPNGWWRDTAQRLLVLRQDRSVVPALRDLAHDSAGRVGRFHALWTLEGLDALDADLVREALKSDDPPTRVQAIRLAESLAKAGDSSMTSDVRALTKDPEPDVVIQALLTLNALKVPDASALIRATVEATGSRGVREIGGQLLQPREGGDEFPRFRFTADQRKLLTRGSAIYRELCISCHGADGRGAPLAGAPEGVTMAPPLAGSPRVQGHRDYVIDVLLHGLVGPVDGKTYQSLMAPMGSNEDGWIAAVASYVRNAFGNSASVISEEEVATTRAAAGGRSFPWTVEALESTLPGFLRYRPDWRVTASHNPEEAGFAINSPGFIRWDSGAPQEPGMWFQIELPEPVTLGEIILDSPGGFGVQSYPRGYKVQVSPDGRAWSDPVAEGEGSGPTTRITLKPVPARAVRITLTESAPDGATWTIQKTRLYEAVKPPTAEDRAPRIGRLAVAEALDAAVATRGDAARGERLFAELSCIACHTTKADQPAKGPSLAAVAKTYRRRELAEQILAPSKVIAKGYETHLVALNDGRQVEGFVVRETPEAVTLRTAAAEERAIPVAEIEERSKSDKSIMPEGLAANLTVAEFASLLDYLEGLVPAETSPALPRSGPEAQGIPSSAILDFIETADADIDALHSFMLVRHGQVVAEGWWAPYSADSPHALYSLSKSFTSTAVGLAVGEGKLSVDDEVLKFFPDEAPAEPSDKLKAMRVSDLLRMSTGHQSEPSVRGEENWARAFLAQPVPHKPGTHFLYNTAATYMLSAIVQKATGQTVLDYLRPRLFEPLGIENPTWGTSPQGVTLGGYGLSVRTEDIARFGQLYLQKGRWQGKQLVPESWVEAATARQTSNGSNPRSDWDRGYGYQFWRCRHNAYRGDGAFGQYCVVLPEQDAVIAINSGVKDMQSVLNLVWDKLLPAMRPSPLPEDPEARGKLERRLAGLSLRIPEGSGSTQADAKVASRTYRFPSNDRKLEAMTVEAGEGGDTVLIARVDGVDRRIVCGRGAWKKGRLALGGMHEGPAAASGAWTEDGTFVAKVCFYETPFLVTLRLKFSGDELFLDSESNVGFGSTKQPQLVGRAE